MARDALRVLKRARRKRAGEQQGYPEKSGNLAP
jgi:hypothetical protein